MYKRGKRKFILNHGNYVLVKILMFHFLRYSEIEELYTKLRENNQDINELQLKRTCGGKSSLVLLGMLKYIDK